MTSANPSVSGQLVTLTATVAPGDPGPGSGYPTGTVTFDDGSSVLGTATLSNGTASIITSSLSVGGHSLSASFAPGSSDPDFLASTSATLNQTVNQDGMVVTLSEPPTVTNPSLFGQPVTIDVSVAAAYPGSGTPSGSVVFQDGSTVLGTREPVRTALPVSPYPISRSERTRSRRITRETAISWRARARSTRR